MDFHFRRTCRMSVEHGKSKHKKLFLPSYRIVSDCLVVCYMIYELADSRTCTHVRK